MTTKQEKLQAFIRLIELLSQAGDTYSRNSMRDTIADFVLLNKDIFEPDRELIVHPAYVPPKTGPYTGPQPEHKRVERWTEVWKEIFLESLRQWGNVSRAAKTAGIHRSTATYARNNDEQFAADWAEAIDISNDYLQETAWQRATEGVNKGIYYQGERVDTEKVMSDNLLALLLRGNMPEKFAEKNAIRVEPEQVAILKKFGLTPSDAFHQLILDMEAAWKKEHALDG